MNSEKYRNKLGNKHPGILRKKTCFILSSLINSETSLNRTYSIPKFPSITASMACVPKSTYYKRGFTVILS